MDLFLVLIESFFLLTDCTSVGCHRRVYTPSVETGVTVRRFGETGTEVSSKVRFPLFPPVWSFLISTFFTFQNPSSHPVYPSTCIVVKYLSFYGVLTFVNTTIVNHSEDQDTLHPLLPSSFLQEGCRTGGSVYWRH